MPLNGIENLLVDSLDYKTIKRSLLKGVRKTVKLVPASNNVFQNRQKIHFDIPALGFLDTMNSKLIFNVKNSSNTTTIRFNNFIECIFNRVNFCLGDGSSVIEDIKQYNVKASGKYKYMVSQDYADSIGMIQQGYTLNDTVATSWAQSGKQYAVPLISSGVMNGNLKYIPLGIMAKQGGYSRSMTLDLWTEDPALCMTLTGSGGTNKSYTITDMYYQLEIIECPEFEEALLTKINANELVLTLPFTSCNTDSNQISANQQGQITQYIPSHDNEYLTGVNTVFLPPYNPSVQYTYNFAKPADLQGYQYLLKDRWFPVQQLDMSTIEVDPGVYEVSAAAQMNELFKYFGKNNRSFDKSCISNFFTTSPSLLVAVGGNFAVTDGQDIEVDFTANTPAVNQDYTITASTITVPVSGYYRINASCIINNFSDDATSTNITSTLKFCINSTGSIVNLNSRVISIKDAVTNLTGVKNNSELSLNFVALLSSDIEYSLNLVCAGSNAHANISVITPSITMSIVSQDVTVQADTTQSTNFMLAQTFKTFYDNIDFLDSAGEFMLDGLNMSKDSTPLTFKMSVGSTPSTIPFNTFHFTDYIGAITIDANAVNVVK